MKLFLFIALSCSQNLYAQKPVPRFENDTLYTTSGFKMFSGQTIKFAKGTGDDGAFRFIRLVGGNEKEILTDNSVIVKKLNKFNISELGNAYIHVRAAITYKDSLKGEIKFNMAFERAIESFPGLPSEVIVPEEFRKETKVSVNDGNNKLNKLYQDSTNTEAQKLVPRFENDTLYTSCGYKIYPGQILHFAKGTARDKRFAHVRFIGVCCEEKNLPNNTVTVIKLSKYHISGAGTAYIRVRGSMVFPGGDKLKIDFNMAFDEAIKETETRSPELIVPDEFRNKKEQNTNTEL